eukprot:CAMPEP_0119118006 /NCGR_PEP_ID=MMETSP1180-20130426/53161_1 /TAXON_ID=3052 ORGANISM="Chlamydomonas cf sp, Strain CCMP681" /NCGR_SAMPLE_ID=MMETSP1180 /ASSEMBLY_ACC=CAM_ASM_000741 /LENGTH=38 /DNA_ID= /DNA_START= /DNA_END= /DNA_ORIENTATION=
MADWEAMRKLVDPRACLMKHREKQDVTEAALQKRARNK